MPEFNENKSVLKELLEFAKQSATVNLLESGVNANFTQPILEILNSAVINGGSVDDLVSELELFIVGDQATLGQLERYTSQISRDSLMQFSATYEEVLSDELGFEFYRYVGTRIRDTRPFCVKFLNDYFHKKEVEQLGRGINPITGKPLSSELKHGRIKGTNASNIFTNRGGWNCRHRFTAVNTQFVPETVIKRAKDKGFI